MAFVASWKSLGIGSDQPNGLVELYIESFGSADATISVPPERFHILQLGGRRNDDLNLRVRPVGELGRILRPMTLRKSRQRQWRRYGDWLQRATLPMVAAKLRAG
jgi:hypothetical protein